MMDTKKALTKDILRIFVWNANGILQQANELEYLLNTYAIDIALINETHLNPTKNVYFYSYETYRSDRVNKTGGWTAVFIKRDLPHYQHNFKDLITIEATAVKANTRRRSILFAAIYKLPQVTLQTQDLDELTQTGKIVFAGDLNCKYTNWNSRTTTANGRTLNEHANNNDYLVNAPNEPTFYPSNYLQQPYIIDVVLTDIGITPEDLTVLHELDSDHNPIFCEIMITADIEIKGLTKNQITCNWDTFKTKLEDTLPVVHPIQDMEEAEATLHLFTSTVQKAYRAQPGSQSHTTPGKITHN
uniref:Endonuclease/exonuclease/phosphatase domain-containing protein n=1 Tax=Timema poppense TaxID=170557 RepID=A0A7R9GWX3_TIMPO|nr:unnamed protein product [Timema poppensis]